MKYKSLAAIMAVGISASAFGQGIILQNVGTSLGGTNGAVFMANGSRFDGINNNLGVTITGGPAGGSLAPVGQGTYKANSDSKGYTGLDSGVFALGAIAAAVPIPGVAPGGVAQIQLQIWFDGSTAAGLFPNYAAAVAGQGEVKTVTFLNGTSNPPLTPPPLLTGMPDVRLEVPEPSTLALAGLGIASLWVLRRRQ